ncbi:MAG: general secretion pathway protein GspK [Planctomycetota bacterium]
MNETRRRRVGRERRRGVIIVVVLVVVALLTLAAYTFAELMLTHYESAQLSGRQLRSRNLVDSGVEAVRMYLIGDEAMREEAGGDFNNPMFFQAVPVAMSNDPMDQGNFTVLVPNIDDEGNLSGIRYGLEDESARLNINALVEIDTLPSVDGRGLLMGLPGMTEDVADAILDWMDEDEEAREYGCESEYYQELDPPYHAKNGPLDTLEELLLVRGVTPELLFGSDTNRNGMVDTHEMNPTTMLDAASTTAETTSVDTSMGSLDRGWLGYLTLHSQEKNVNSLGEPRIDLNMDDLEALYESVSVAVSEDWARFIVLYRQYGPYDGDEQGESVSVVDVDFSKEGETRIAQVLDLIGKKVEVPEGGDDEGTVVAPVFPESEVEMAVYMPMLMDAVTVVGAPVIPGRLNINRAPRPLLMGIPGIEETTVDEIINQRALEPADEDEAMARRHETWLLTSGIVTLEEMKALSPMICAGGDVFRAQIVGYHENGIAACRAEVIFDATAAVPRVVSWKEISHLGRGYPLDVLGLQTGGMTSSP